MNKKAYIQLLCLPTFLHLRMRPKVHCFWSVIRRRIRFFDMMLHCSCKTNWTKKIQSNLWRKLFFVIFNDCQDMLHNVDEIISWPFPVNRVQLEVQVFTGNWQLETLTLVLFYNQFLNNNRTVFWLGMIIRFLSDSYLSCWINHLMHHFKLMHYSSLHPTF